MCKIIYLLAIIFLCFSSIVYIKSAKDIEKGKPSPISKKLTIAAFISAGINLIIGIISLSGVLDREMFGNIFLFCGIMSVLETGIYLLYRKFGMKTLKFMLKSVFVASILEMTIFNYPSFYMWNSDFKEFDIDYTKICIQNENSRYDSNTGTLSATGPGEFGITIPDFNNKLGSVYADIEMNKNTKRVLLTIDAGDDAQNAELRYGYISRYIINGRENSQTIQTLFSGNVHKLVLRFNLENYGENAVIKNITLNKPIQFSVSLLRLAATLLLPILVYVLYASVIMRRPFEKNKKICFWAAGIATALLCSLAVGIINGKLEGSWADEFRKNSGNQITEELVDAFSCGQANLLKEPPQELLDLDNPYDRTARDSMGSSFEWDHLLYNGKYYSYYGIAPVILLFMPYHSITGYYFSTPVAILIFSVIGIVGLTLAYLAFIRKWFGKLRSGIVLAGLLMIHTVSGIWFSLGRNDIYEIAESAGFAFLTWGVWLLISSGIIGKSRISFVKTAFSSLLLGISVMCRPTLAVYCICAALFMILAFPRAGTVSSADGTQTKKKSRYAVYAACAVLPMLTIAVLQMWYNYIRFDSPLDFGIQYSLTINDFTNAQYHTKLSLVPIYNYLLAPPSFKMGFPFVWTDFQMFDVEGFFYADLVTCNTSGMVFLILPMFAYLYSFKALRTLPDRKSRLYSAMAVALPCIIMPVIIMAAVWESGYSIRYTVDFAWIMTLGAFAVYFFLYLNERNNTRKGLMTKFFMFSMVWTFVVGGFQTANQLFNNAYSTCYDIQYTIEQAFAFWK